MVSIIVIDDGISINDENVMRKVKNAYYIDNSGKISLDMTGTMVSDTHGGKCAYIIYDIYQAVEFTSMRILSNSGRCSAVKLKIALQWCLLHDYDIIHMSLSTRNFYTYSLIQDVIKTLVEQNKLLVAAIDNLNLISFPAFFDGVFAVFMDNERLFEEQRIGIYYVENLKTYAIGMQYKTSRISENGSISNLDCANSYAAAAFSGYLANFLSGKTNYTLQEIRKGIFEGKVTRVGNIPKISTSKSKRVIPVIGVIDDKEDIIRTCESCFAKKGYQVTVFTEIKTEKYVPLNFYFDDQIVINESFLSNMDRVYSSDLIILQVYKLSQIKSKEIDIIIKCSGSQLIVILNGENEKIFMSVQKMLEHIENVLGG